MSKRPENLIYAVNERPPIGKLMILGLQQFCIISIYLLLVVIIFKEAGASHDVVQRGYEKIGADLILLVFFQIFEISSRTATPHASLWEVRDFQKSEKDYKSKSSDDFFTASEWGQFGNDCSCLRCYFSSSLEGTDWIRISGTAS